jgi:hypothetical protein
MCAMSQLTTMFMSNPFVHRNNVVIKFLTRKLKTRAQICFKQGAVVISYLTLAQFPKATNNAVISSDSKSKPCTVLDLLEVVAADTTQSWILSYNMALVAGKQA